VADLYFSCPVCGEDVPRNAKSCPECGACEKSGWSEDQYLDGLNLPDEDYTTGRPLNAGPQKAGKPGAMQRVWWVVAVLVIVALLWMTLRGLW